MRNTKLFLLSTAIAVLAAGVPLAGPATAQPVPPPGLPAPPMIGDLHVRIVPQARPRMRREVRSPRPDRNHVWQGGYWHHTGSEWSWNDGRWAAPPQRRARWIAPRYQKVRGGYRYVPGHWSHERLIYN